MSIIDNIGRLGATLRIARRNRRALREINALPPELQKDIGWPASSEARAALNVRNRFWETLR
jgi:hypothetical protein